MTLAADPALFEAYHNRFAKDFKGTIDDRHAVEVVFARLRMVGNAFLQVQEVVVDESVFIS